MNKQKWIQCALENGFESFQIRSSEQKHRKLSWFDGQAESFEASDSTGNVLRGLYGGKMANFATEDTDDANMESVIAGMKERAGFITSEDKEFIREPEKTEEVTSSRVWVRPDSAEVLALLADLEKRILAYDKRIIQVTDLQWSDGTSSQEIVNSYGMNVSDRGGVQLLIAGAAASDGKDVKNDYNVKVVEDFSKFDADAFVKKLCDSVISKVGATSIPSGNYPVIFEKDAMTDLFSAFMDMFSGELVGRSIRIWLLSLTTQETTRSSA